MTRHKPRHEEAQIQRAIFTRLAYMDRQIPELRWIHAIPNGGRRNLREAKLLKAEGMKAGVLDIFWPWPRPRLTDDLELRFIEPQVWCGLYLEIKAGKNTLSDKQEEFAEFVIAKGYAVRVSYDPIDAVEIIKRYAAGTLSGQPAADQLCAVAVSRSVPRKIS